MGAYGFAIIALAVIFIIPWAIVASVAIFARDHFRAFMPYYIGGAFAVEILLFAFLFVVAV